MFISRRKALVSTGISLAATTIAGCATYGKPPAAPAAEPAPTPHRHRCRSEVWRYRCRRSPRRPTSPSAQV